jgi:hypothetical protein
MPGMDRTGPFGTGPRGRGMGPCGGGQPGLGRGFRSRQGGIGWGVAQAAVPTEKEALEQRQSWLEEQLATVAQRLQELKGNKD